MASLAEMRARLQQLNQRTGKKQNDIWKAKDEHDVRLLPNPKGLEAADPFEVLVFHYELGGTSVLCPLKNFGEPCAVCDYCEKLRAWKEPSGEDKAEVDRKADFEIFKKIQPTEKAFVRLVERMKDGTPSPEGPKWWSPGFTNNNKIIDLCSNTERMEMLDLDPTDDASGLKVLFDVNKAFDIHIRFSDAAGKPNAKGNKKNRAVTEITEAAMKARPVSKDKDEVRKILEACKPLSDVYPKQSSEEVATILAKFLGSVSGESKAEGGTEKYSSNSDEDTSSKMGGKSIDEAFGDINDV